MTDLSGDSRCLPSGHAWYSYGGCGLAGEGGRGGAGEEVEDGFDLGAGDGGKFSASSSRVECFRLVRIAETGTRVPRKTQAPLTLPGTLSRTGQADQSSIVFVLMLPY